MLGVCKDLFIVKNSCMKLDTLSLLLTLKMERLKYQSKAMFLRSILFEVKPLVNLCNLKVATTATATSHDTVRNIWQIWKKKIKVLQPAFSVVEWVDVLIVYTTKNYQVSGQFLETLCLEGYLELRQKFLLSSMDI